MTLPEGQTIEPSEGVAAPVSSSGRRESPAARSAVGEASGAAPRADAGRIAALQAAARRSAVVLVPLMLFTASMLMALAWLGHLKFKHWPFAQALFACWLIVLPEYFLNISAIRIGYRYYSGAQMATFRLCSGVLCVALVSRFVLGEELTDRQLLGFGVMAVAMMLVGTSRPDGPGPREAAWPDGSEAERGDGRGS